jgi:single-strand DNA-binding protein
MNQITLLGNLTKDLEQRQVGETPVFSGTLAVPRGYTDKTDFINISIWGVLGERTAKFNGKGSKLLVTGELNIDQSGDKYYTKVNVRTVEFLSPRQNNDRKDLMDNSFVDKEVPKVEARQVDAYDFEAEQQRTKDTVEEIENSDLPF